MSNRNQGSKMEKCEAEKREDESSIFLGAVCHCCQICYATVSLFPCLMLVFPLMRFFTAKKTVLSQNCLT